MSSNGFQADDRFQPWWNQSWPLTAQIYAGVPSLIWQPQVYTNHYPSSTTITNAQSLAVGIPPGFTR